MITVVGILAWLVDFEMPKLATTILVLAMTIASFVFYISRIAALSIQWCQYEQKPFFFIPRVKATA